MCYEYEWETMLRRAEEARKALQKSEEEMRKKPRPAAPAPAPEPRDVETVPV